MSERRVADSSERPVGVFDSGVGGLSVVREIQARLPGERLLYLADSAHCPYGARSRQELIELTRGITRWLLSQGAKLVVVACNTASVAALGALRSTFDVPFVGIVPAVKPAALATRTRRIGILATPVTFQMEMFNDLVRNFAADVEVCRQVCPGLVELAERGIVAGPEVEEPLRRYLEPLLTAGVDTIVLGCTHYPFFRPVIERLAGPEVTVIDTGDAIARQVERVLGGQRLLRRDGCGELLLATTGDVVRFATVASHLLGATPNEVVPVDLDADTPAPHRPTRRGGDAVTLPDSGDLTP
ncbi:MAG: glutamate racemase [Chloroflexi bacterium]|nr:glutamate racemase [Chloroflexota bacterium]